MNELETQGYLILKQVISPDVCALLSDYAQLKAKNRPNVRKNKDPLADIHREYADPMMEVLLDQLTPQVEQAVGLSLWPTLSFYYAYQQGNRLASHTDRNSCQFVAGLCIGVDKAYQAQEGSWPLVIEHGGKQTPVRLDAGDMMIFKGHDTPHWREPFSGEWFVSAIFGYVDQQGPFAFQKYDQRASLGAPHIGMFRWSFGCFKQKLRQLLDKK
ncbi:MAG: hypothetical protein NTW08_07965 [Gammaproteobacteria bacterium]|nr:hypothetical protein [Gammaproteobacteria bacterium]